MADNKFKEKFRRSYKDEYEALYEAMCGLEHNIERQTENDDGRYVDDCDDNLQQHDRLPDEEINIAERYDDLKIYYPYDNEEATSRLDYNDVILADLTLEKIFDLLSIQEKYYAGLVCRNWYRGFCLPNSWRTLIFDDITLTKKVYNYYSGHQYLLAHDKLQMFLTKVGRYIKTVIIKPFFNFHNLYEFMNIFSFYAEHTDKFDGIYNKAIGSNITTFYYTFPCDMSSNNQPRIYGTGGKVLDALKRFIANLPSLKTLQLIDLMLDAEEAKTLLDHLCYTHCLILKRLTIINVSKTECELLHLGVFLNLQVLETSPQSLGEDVLYLIGESKIRHLHITQNSYTTTDIKALSPSSWRKCVVANPDLRVHLSVRSKYDVNLLFQPAPSPVSTVLFDSQFMKLNPEIINQAVSLYSNTLKRFVSLGLPKYHQSRSFSNRIDTSLLLLCQKCPSLETLIIRDKISTSTILLIADAAKNLQSLYIRRASVLLRADCPKNSEWTDEFQNWLKITARSYDNVEKEISNILGYRWTLMSDREFKRISPELYR